MVSLTIVEEVEYFEGDQKDELQMERCTKAGENAETNKLKHGRKKLTKFENDIMNENRFLAEMKRSLQVAERRSIFSFRKTDNLRFRMVTKN